MKRRKSDKGGPFERQMARRLSLWWSAGARDDMFWRVGGSGGRAKRRGRKGQRTFGQHADIAATDPQGEPLTDVFTIEAKRGYSRYTPFDLLDKGPTAARQMVETWLLQVQESCQQAGSLTWLLIFRRDQRRAVVGFDTGLFSMLSAKERQRLGSPPQMRMTFEPHGDRGPKERVTFMRLEDFFDNLAPSTVRRLSES